MRGRDLLTLLLLCAGIASGCVRERPSREPVLVYVVRHAERADDGATADMMQGDPPLSLQGQDRARRLAELLRAAGLTHVHSTDLVRTRSTAQPVVESTGLPLELYDADDGQGLAERLEATPGVHLVVGHSNTAPALVEALGGDPGEPIEPLEYDRIYVVYVLPDGSAGSALFRFGSPAGAGP